MKRETFLKQGRCVALAACTLLIGTGMMTSCVDKDENILTGQPEWLGNSIYERLEEEGNYTYMLRLIDDLNQKEVLGHTGSKTLFPANDDAFNEWFKANNTSFEQLSTAQKKLMLNNAMINNAYLIELMSNVSGNPPKTGMAMRRLTAGNQLDSVQMMTVEEMPQTDAWAGLRSRGKTQAFVNRTLAPMIHFLPPFMKYYNITNEDLEILTNHQSHSVAESWVNGKKVVEADITCKNGYIHRVDGVVESSPNMAEMIRKQKNLSHWSRLLDRFSAPYLANQTAQDNYQRMYNTTDSLFIQAYFSKQDGQTINFLPDGVTPVPAQLSFDPAWNGYMYTNTMDYDLHYDAGAMIVPTDSALLAWWNHGGRDLQDEYKELDSIPYETLAKLINVNMLPTFTETVPSKFGNILDDAKEKLGITPDHVKSCYMCCNGVVYVVDTLYSPREYASVAYPALAHKSLMDVFYWAVENRSFLPYLLSMDAEYVFLMPNNNAMLSYIDPSTYGNMDNQTGEASPDVIQFSLDKTKAKASQMTASRYLSNVAADGTITLGVRKQMNVASSVINTMLDDMLDQMIIVLPTKGKKLMDYLNEGYQFFRTKGGTLIQAKLDATGKKPLFAGGYQMEQGRMLEPDDNSFNKQNGVSYMLTDQMPLGAQKSFFVTLDEHPEYSAFKKLISCDYSYINYTTKSKLLTTKLSGKYAARPSDADFKNFSLFDNYNYTVFVPQNDSIEWLQANGFLPTDEELVIDEGDYTVLDSLIKKNCDEWKIDTLNITTTVRDNVIKAISKVVTDFVRYHVQDHALAIGLVPESGSDAYESMLRNPETGRFYQLTTNYTNSEMTVKDVAGYTHKVVKTDGLYNNMCREYFFKDSGNSAQLYMGSDAMVHQIDGPLYPTWPRKPWRQIVKEELENN